MKTTKALSFFDLRRYRWFPHLLITMTLFAVLAGIGLIRFVEDRFVEATGGELTLAAAEVAEKLGLKQNGYRLVFNNGPNAGEAVPHLHCHILGGRPMTWPPG